VTPREVDVEQVSRAAAQDIIIHADWVKLMCGLSVLYSNFLSSTKNEHSSCV
jgi:hypothetical protein